MRRAMSLLLLLMLLVPTLPSAAQGRAPIYFRATGHHLTDELGFLSFWELHGGEEVLGLPVTEVVEEEGLYVQYLERARLEYHADIGEVLLGRLGAERTRWRTFPPAPPTLASADMLRFEETGHTLSQPFRAFWEAHDGLAIFGMPISEPLWEAVGGGFYRVQYFERARLEHRPSYGSDRPEVQVSTLGVDVARAKGYDLGRVAQRGDAQAIGSERPAAADLAPLREPVAQPAAVEATPEPVVAPPAPVVAPEAVPVAAPPPAPAPTAVPAPPPAPAPAPQPVPSGEKTIAINLSEQWLYAYEGGVLVYSAPVATGKDGFNTPVGTFRIYHKVEVQTMRGSANGESWEVPNVPHAMYFTGGVALHGTYWHNLFGTGIRISHGCVNLRLGDAAWLYQWAPVGTLVTVHF